MKTIYKYKLNFDVTVIKGPIEEILDVQWQNGIGPVLWASVDTDKKDKIIYIGTIGTGWELPWGIDRYIGTVQDDMGYVWHNFIINPKEMKQKHEETDSEWIQMIAAAMGSIGVSAKEATESLEGLFDACM